MYDDENDNEKRGIRRKLNLKFIQMNMNLYDVLPPLRHEFHKFLLCFRKISEYFLIRDSTRIPSILWFEYTRAREEVR